MGQEQTEPLSQLISSGTSYPLTEKESSPVPGNRVFATDRLLLKKLLRAIGNPQVKVVLWDGRAVENHVDHSAARVSVYIRDRGALFRLISNPELNFGEMYSSGRIDVQGNLLDFLEEAYRTWPWPNQARNGKMLLAPFQDKQRNTITRARHNIRHHYDIGNDFYQLWLDQRMVYTCAYFPSRDMTLEDAQLAKMHHVCRKLELQPGARVVEAGCGWGALSLHMARHYGVTVQAYNISHEQIAYARQRARAEGLDGQVEFIEDDYRNVRGQCDAFVSVGMLEHVGMDHYRELGAVMDRCMKDDARGLIHSIGLNYPRPMDAWAKRNIFPGAAPPSLGQMMQIFEPFDFSVLDVENLRLHYARTLEHWLQRYEENAARVAEMFDAEFVRAWRLYLAGSLTAFKMGSMQLFQVAFARAGNNRIPWSRQHLYPSQGAGNGNL